jgi:hypothetical protein
LTVPFLLRACLRDLFIYYCNGPTVRWSNDFFCKHGPRTPYSPTLSSQICPDSSTLQPTPMLILWVPASLPGNAIQHFPCVLDMFPFHREYSLDNQVPEKASENVIDPSILRSIRRVPEVGELMPVQPIPATSGPRPDCRNLQSSIDVLPDFQLLMFSLHPMTTASTTIL